MSVNRWQCHHTSTFHRSHGADFRQLTESVKDGMAYATFSGGYRIFSCIHLLPVDGVTFDRAQMLSENDRYRQQPLLMV